jgi:REP element-mobilizing transposase RayT
METRLVSPSILLDPHQRSIVSSAISEVCQYREYELKALNVRTNHVHAVVSKAIKPEKIVNDFKAYATRRLRGEWQFAADGKVWARGASTRYLWKPKHVVAAVDYVLYCQEDIPFEFK